MAKKKKDVICKSCGSEVEPAIPSSKCTNCGVRFTEEEVQDDTEA